MGADIWTKCALFAIVVLLCVNFLQNLLPPQPAFAVRNPEGMGRYQITSWAAHSGGSTEFNGYYILDTATGKIVDQKTEMKSSVK